MRLILKGVNNIEHSFPFEFHNYFVLREYRQTNSSMLR